MREQKRQWWKESVAYQIYPRSFQDSNGDGIGDLRGITERLDYLQYLGIDLLWLSPVYDSPNDDNGYDIRDYHGILDEYGTMEDMDELLEEARKRGIRLVMDLVANHTSDEHAWFIESRSSKDSPKRDWYIWRPGNEGAEPTNWECAFGGSAWEYDENSGEYYLHCFSKKQPDLNWENEEVRQALYSMIHWWMDKGIAGFRVDAITYIKKNPAFPQLAAADGRRYAPVEQASLNQEGILDFLRELKQEALEPRSAITVAEAPGVPLEQIRDFVDETDGVFTMLFQFSHVDLDIKPGGKAEFTDWDMKKFKEALSLWQRESNRHGWMGLFLENHDHVRSVSKFGDDGQYRDLSAKMLATYYFLMRGTPFIYQGQEIGMTNCPFDSIDEYRDISSLNLYREETAKGRPASEILDYLGKRSRDQGRTPMQWNADREAGFTSGTPWIKVNPNYTEINVENNMRDEHSVLQFYRKLIALRRQYSALVYGFYEELCEDSADIGMYRRTHEGETFIVVCNFTADRVEWAGLTETLAGGERVLSNYETEAQGSLRPYEAAVYRWAAVT
ncbi:alpha-glucosidase [Paenibacillus sp. 7541]|uniref:glycoside hydrolase family 13 protein n=1 Tax=Paenibacillus sp. 7541 TaxID=2026236 RepID=UPI000BA5300A|nr:alpha-glucosidase [Paenibacillus sp. 7541]PAK52039.1 glucohydrolase [Paenibacillus sp. 7541]